jgi:hypothetical protein
MMLAACCAALGMLVGASHASAAGWAVQATQPELGLPNGDLHGVSCSSSNACIAVGTKQADQWNGTAWSLVSGGSGDAVSCTPTGWCAAVNSAGSAAGTIGTKIWNGNAWRSVAAPEPAGATSATLAAVSCRSKSACTAVGNSVATAGQATPLIESWDGASWHIATVPSPSGTTVELDGVSCPTNTSCIAVGHADSHTIAEHWNGTSWSIQPTPDGPGGGTPNGHLLAVSCAASDACEAVGYSARASTFDGLAERWNGKSWIRQRVPGVGKDPILLRGVSCPARTACTAVGQLGGDDTSGGRRLLAAQWTGSAWQTQTTPHPAAASMELDGVSCVAITDCITVGRDVVTAASGETDDHAVSERWSSGTWSLLQTPTLRPRVASASFAGISCAAANLCMAVGAKSSGEGHVAIAERWNGVAWLRTQVPEPAGAATSELQGVSCASAQSCTAVGWWAASDDLDAPLVMRWDGSHWTLDSVPNPADGRARTLSGVSCPSSNRCEAVGGVSGNGPSSALLDGWNGTAWAIQTAPVDATGGQALAVSCAVPTACLGVGGYTSGELALAWNGSHWTGEPVEDGDGLDSVSCPATNQCWAVDDVQAQAWDGTMWSTPWVLPEGDSHDDDLLGISCLSMSDCTAVGVTTPFGGTSTVIAYAWNGSGWSTTNPPMPTSATQLNAVSCLQSGSCFAAGYAGRSVLVERYTP